MKSNTYSKAAWGERNRALALAAARVEGFSRVSEIVGLCACAGLSARATQKFLKPDVLIESLRQQIEAAGVRV